MYTRIVGDMVMSGYLGVNRGSTYGAVFGRGSVSSVEWDRDRGRDWEIGLHLLLFRILDMIKNKLS